MKCQSCHHIKTSHLICSVSQLTGFYMMANAPANILYQYEYTYRHEMKNYVRIIEKNYFFQNNLVFIDLFHRYHYPNISFTQVACDAMCVQHVIQ